MTMAPLGRSTKLSAGFTSSIFFFFIRQLPPSSLNGTRPKQATCSEVSATWTCMSEIWSIPLKIGAQKPSFRRLRNLTANLTAYIFRTKSDIHNRSSELETHYSYSVAIFHEHWPTNGLKLDRHFTHPVNAAFHFIYPGFADGDQQTELNQTLLNGGL